MSGVDQRKTAMVQQSDLSDGARARTLEGWRAGKPTEDPEKLKRWGRVSARPSEYLIHMRAGKVRTSSSGQGASCFKLPSDAVAVVPTTVQKLRFSADQVTREKVGVEITGLAVYRIAEPLIAFRMLNFSFPERAQQKLEEMLIEMFAGATRRLVANLTVDECLSRRKEGIAAELMREIAPVVSGQGRIDDETDMGWGVIIDTIEIQDVRILSSAVFSNMQARYRQTQELEAREAALTTERAVKLGEAEATRRIELAQLAATSEVHSRRQEAEEAGRLGEIAATARVMEAKLTQKRVTEEAEIEAGRVVLLAKIESERLLAERRRIATEQHQVAELAKEARLAEARLAEEQRAAEQRLAIEGARAQLEAEVEAARHTASLARVEHELAHLRIQAEISAARRAIAESEVAIAEIASRQAILAQAPELARARALREIENSVSPEAVRLMVAQRMPDLAAAFQQNMGHVNVTAIGGENPFGYIVAAVDGVLGMARAAGLDLPMAKDRTPAS
ncbi:MAG: SPFH domain-containing protein [Byssovorax sp.]